MAKVHARQQFRRLVNMLRTTTLLNLKEVVEPVWTLGQRQ
jgi:hypothetical protein